MPYIEKQSREYWDVKMKPLVDAVHKDVEGGKINYIITKILLKWIMKNTRYASICKVVGTCQCVMMEFYARLGRPYEDKKREQNGDVYPEE